MRRTILIFAWIALLLAPVTMIIGHFGSHDLNWEADHISTYAAHAPRADWITASMLLSALALVCIGILTAGDDEIGKVYVGPVASMVLGAAVSGLLLLAAFKETAPTDQALLNLGFESLRQQAFHESGLFMFFFGSVIASCIVGSAVMVKRGGLVRRMIGGVIAACAPASLAALSFAWPKYIGIAGESNGLRQRAAFLILWIGAVSLLALITKDSPVREKG